MNRTEVLLCKEISDVTTELIGFNLSIDQNFPSLRNNDDCQVIDWGKAENLSVVFKNIDYMTIYDELERDRNYNIKMIDGALIQLMYKVKQNLMISHRLAFFPNPRLENFQNDRKEAALAETAALLVLRKKAQAINSGVRQLF